MILSPIKPFVITSCAAIIFITDLLLFQSAPIIVITDLLFLPLTAGVFITDLIFHIVLLVFLSSI